MPVFEPAHRAIPLFNAAMILLQMVVEIALGAMRYLVPKDIPTRAWVGIMAIRGDPVGHHPGHRLGGAEKGLGRCEVACLAEPHIDQIPVAVDGPVEVVPLALHLDVGLVYIPAVPCSTATFLT